MRRLMRNFYFSISLLCNWPVFFLKRVKVGRGNRLERGLVISKSTIGNYNYLGHGCILDKVQVGSYCSIAAHVQIGGAEHPMTMPSTSFRLFPQGEKQWTIIEDDVWIGAKVVIRSGVKVGRGAVIGSGAIVLEDIPSYAIAVGMPAKIIRYRFDQGKIDKLAKTNYWELSPEDALKVLKDKGMLNG